MVYNKEDIKKIGLRIAKNINHDLQRSKMNPYLKPYFTESTAQYIDNEKFQGILLNVRPLDLQDSLDEMEEVRFTNNMKLLQETVNYYLKKEKLTDLFELKNYSNNATLMEMDGTYINQYQNFALAIKNENTANQTYMQDMIDDKVKSLVPGFTVNSYSITPEDIAGSTTKELEDEISGNSQAEGIKFPKVLADPMQGKMAIHNSSSYSKLNLDPHITQSDIMI